MNERLYFFIFYSLSVPYSIWCEPLKMHTCEYIYIYILSQTERNTIPDLNALQTFFFVIPTKVSLCKIYFPSDWIVNSLSIQVRDLYRNSNIFDNIVSSRNEIKWFKEVGHKLKRGKLYHCSTYSQP